MLFFFIFAAFNLILFIMYRVYPPRSWRGYVATSNIPTLVEAVKVSVKDYDGLGHIKFYVDDSGLDL